MAATWMRLKGLGDIVVGLILAVKPSIIYESAVTKLIHRHTGLVRIPFSHMIQVITDSETPRIVPLVSEESAGIQPRDSVHGRGCWCGRCVSLIPACSCSKVYQCVIVLFSTSFFPILILPLLLSYISHLWHSPLMSTPGLWAGLMCCCLIKIGLCGSVARPKDAMYFTWALLAGLTLFAPKELELGSATMLMTCLNGTIYSVTAFLLDRRASKKSAGKGRAKKH